MAANGRLIVTLAAEVAGYSRLIRADEKGALEQLEAHRDQFVYPKFAEHSGRIVRATGDNLLVEFESATEAVRCAVELQSGMIDRNFRTLPDRRVTFRVGVTIDQVTGNGDDLVIRAVAALPRDTLVTLIKPGAEVCGERGNIAMRLAALAEPAGICISGAVRDAIGDQFPYMFKDIGKQNLEIGAAPVDCYAIRVTNVTGQNGETKADPRPPQAIHNEPSRVERLLSSVLLCAGLGLTAAAAAAGGWAVWNSVPPKSAPVAAEKPAPPPPAVAEKPPTPPSEPEHQAPADHPFASEDEKPPEDAAGRALLDRGWALVTPPYSAIRWQQARQDFEKALGQDADSNEARIGLAYVLGGKLSDEWSSVLQEDPRRAEQLLVEVLDRGDTANRMAAAHFELGLVHQMQNRLAKAQREFRLSIALEPNNRRAQLHLGEALLYLGDPECALFEQAVRFSSDGDPILSMNYWALGTCHMLIGETDKAIVLLQKARAANDHIWVPYFYLAGAYGLKGDLDNAKSALAESLKLKPAMKSLARMRAENPWLGNPQYSELQEKTLNLGLRQIGFPDQ